MMDRYSNIEILSSLTGKKYFKNIIYPEIPLSENDIYLITDIGDRLDIISRDYYKDESLYWILLSANPTLNQSSLFPEPGVQLRVPTDVDEIIKNFIKINGL
jgi:hypothetical protein